VEKYCRPGQTTGDSMEHMQCMLDTQGYKHTLSICNTYCCFTAPVGTQKRLTVTLHVTLTVFCYFLPCLIYFNCSLIQQAAESIDTCWQKCKCCFFFLAYLTLFIRFHSCNNAEFSLMFVQICVMLGRTKEGM